MLDELMQVYFDKIRNSNLPMMQFLENLPGDQHKKITDKNIESFLQHSLNDTAFENAILIIDRWRANDLFGVPKEALEISDILSVTNFRKQLYFDFLERYTQDLSLFRSIVGELDAFHMQFQKYAFNSYVDIQQEELASENQFISSLINNSIDGILAYDKQLKIRELNAVHEKWYGIKKEDVIGKKMHEVFPDYKNSEEGALLHKALKGERIYISERPFLDREGITKLVLFPSMIVRALLRGE